MQQAQGRVEHVNQVRTSDAGLRLVCAFFNSQARLDQLQIPVAEFSPEEIVNPVGGFMEAIGTEGFVDFLRDAVESGENPAVFESSEIECCNACLRPGFALAGVGEGTRP